jgi:hypothetical protein
LEYPNLEIKMFSRCKSLWIIFFLCNSFTPLTISLKIFNALSRKNN